MTAVAPSSGALRGPPKELLSPLEKLLQNERGLFTLLTNYAVRTFHLRRQDAEDAVSTAFTTAMRRERAGKSWDPTGPKTIEQYMLERVNDAARDGSRTARRKPATPIGDAIDLASAATGGLGGVIPSTAEAQVEVAQFRKLAVELRRHFEEETDGHIPLGIMDQHLRGIVDQEKIAKNLKCTVAKVRAGWGRLKYHGQRVATAARGKQVES